MYIQGLLLIEKESLIPNGCLCGETSKYIGSTRKQYVIDSNRQSFRAKWMRNEIHVVWVLYQYTLLIVTNKICLATRTKLDSFSFSNIL